MAKSKLVKANEKIADAVVNSYKKVEDGLLEDLIKLLISLWRTFLQNMVYKIWLTPETLLHIIKMLYKVYLERLGER